MTTANIAEVKANFSHYARLVKAGETVVVCDRNKPFAELRPLAEEKSQVKGERKLGLMKGKCPIGPEFFAADEEILRDFENSEIFPPGFR